MNDFESKDVVFVDTEDDLRTVLSCFVVNQISHIPAFNQKKFVGMVSKTDFIQHLYNSLEKDDSKSLQDFLEHSQVKEIMIQPVYSAQMSEPEIDIIRKLIDHNIGSVVIKDGERLVGIATEKDMVRYLSQRPTMEGITESLSNQMVQWMEDHGVFRISKILSDIGI